MASIFASEASNPPLPPWHIFTDLAANEDSGPYIGSERYETLSSEEVKAVHMAFFVDITPDDIAKIPDIDTMVMIQATMVDCRAYHLDYPVIQNMFDFVPIHALGGPRLGGELE